MSGSVATVFIDEVEVTDISLEGSATRSLNNVGQAQVKLPMDQAIGGVGSLLKVYFDGVLFHHGRVLLCETSADENFGYTVYNWLLPLELWKWRPVRDPDGDLSKPDIIDFNVFGPPIIEAMIDASENTLLIPTHAEGPLRKRELVRGRHRRSDRRPGGLADDDGGTGRAAHLNGRGRPRRHADRVRPTPATHVTATPSTTTASSTSTTATTAPTAPRQ